MLDERMPENEIRKWIWARKEIVDEAASDESFAALPPEEQDAKVVSLQLDLPEDVVTRCLSEQGSEEELSVLKARIADTFKYGKRIATRSLKKALAGYAHLKTETSDGE